MDFSLSKEQEMLRQSVQKCLQNQGGIEIARSYMDGEPQRLKKTYGELVQLGVTSVNIPEAYGGVGLSNIDLVPVFEETGRVLLPGTLRETVAFATPLIARYGSAEQKEELLSGIANGQMTFALAVVETNGSYQLGDIEGTARRQGDVIHLDAVKTVVHGGMDATAFLVPVRSDDASSDGDSLNGDSSNGDSSNDDSSKGGSSNGDHEGITWLWVERDHDGVTVEPLQSFDATLGLAKVTFSSVQLDEQHVIGKWGNGLEMCEDCVQDLHAAVSAEMIGAMEHVLDSVTEYAKTRVQFGQPIGRFQAVKHRIVDRRLELETAKSLVYYANWAVASGSSDKTAAVYSARSYATEAFIRAASDNIQLHGGIGFTWEMDCHLYLKRARALENYLGSVQDFEEQTASALGW
ncbi:acyl-CoA dehydrogenase family protein [Alicyclobacillus ferrooxydans]|uniref:Acyl-CoA dehydrogenase n=1 Tax=Alicyclobacillus ferrooxydans TaxID=471514 RepID=A0A0P9GU15_9BACL|nr:acyl-CoA dehydrogenase family protein [Alicyclobacillus ferrooxydans]KPV44730.1 hypothetical protein AN477_05400 [Alicyclobacillus ferrooxydans]